MLKQAPIVPYIPVADMDRARKFYEEKVGLKPREDYAGGVIYECGKGSWVFMYTSKGASTSKASTECWAVEDVEAERRGVRGIRHAGNENGEQYCDRRRRENGLVQGY